jgi:uncharacterized protein (TIGR03437 family)
VGDCIIAYIPRSPTDALGMTQTRYLLIALVAVMQLPAATRQVVLPRIPVGFESIADGKLEAREGPYTLAIEPGRSTLTIFNRRTGRFGRVTTMVNGANPDSHLETADPLEGKSNYLVGTDPQRWRVGVSRFARAIDREVYPGIDLAFHGAGGNLEYDFIVKPGGDARRIALSISGATRIRVTRDGALSLTTPAGLVQWKKPVLYQWNRGAREPVKGAFAVRSRTVTFAIGPYDRSRPLIIDPTLAYASYFGGSDDEASRSLAVDSGGNIYLTGGTFSTNLPQTGGSFQPAYHGGSLGTYLGGDVFVAKFAASGALAYVTYLGGSKDDVGGAIAVDSAGNAYITGYTTSSDFPTTNGAFQTHFAGGTGNQNNGIGGDAFVAKLNPSGTALVYSTYLGGYQDEKGGALAVDSAGNAYVGGATLSPNFPTRNPYQSTYGGSGGNPQFCGGCGPLIAEGDGFIAKLNPAGSDLIYSTYFGGQFDDAVTALAVDGSGNVYVGGSTLSADFPVLNEYQSKFGGTLSDSIQPYIKVGDGFVAKFDSTGKLIYSTFLGGSADDAVLGLAIDSTGAAYVAGFTSSANFPVTPKAAQATLHGPASLQNGRTFVWGNAFVAKLAPSGNSLIYSTYLGGSSDDAAWAIAVDSVGEAIVGGFANSTDFPVSSNALQKNFGGSLLGLFVDPTGDGFITTLSADGSSIVYSSYFGGSKDELIAGVAVSTSGNVYVAGSTTSPNLPVTAGAAQKTFGGVGDPSETMGDAFVAVFSGINSTSGNGGGTGGNGPIISDVENGASFAPGLVANAWLTIKGSNFATGFTDWSNSVIGGKLPTSLNGVSVTAGGLPAYVQAISPGQINVVAPNVPAGPLQVTVTTSAGTSAPFSTTAQIFGPAFFLWPGGYAVATRTDFTPAVKPGTFSGLATTAAKPGDTIILWGSGFGPTNPPMPIGVALPSDTTYYAANAPTVTVGGVSTSVLGAALGPGFASAYLVAIQVPPSLADGDYPVVASVNGVPSPSTTMLTVQH